MSYNAQTRYNSIDVKHWASLTFETPIGKIRDHAEKMALARILKTVSRPTRLLDVAAGTGRITQWLMKEGFCVDAVDISNTMVESLRHQFSSDSVRVTHADAACMPFSDDAFDVVCAIRFFGHVPESSQAKVLSEMLRVSRFGVIVSVPFASRWASARRRMLDGLAPRSPHWHPLTQTTWRALVQDCAATIRHTTSIVPLLGNTQIAFLKKN